FTMLEWYRAYADKWQLLEDAVGLINSLNEGKGRRPVDIERISVAELFKNHVGMTLTPETTAEELKTVLSDHGLHWSPDDDWDDLFFRLYIEYIEARLGATGPQAVYDFPATQGSLARMTPEGWADRFEIYWHGTELANAYQEQNN